MADPPLHHATTEPPPRRFVDLPTDIYEEIFKFLDIRSVSRVFKAYSALPSFEDLRRETTKYFRGKVVNVSLKHIIQSNTTEISFDLLAYLPPCDIHVVCPDGLFELAKVYLEQVEYKSLSLEVIQMFGIKTDLNLKGLNGNVVALRLVCVNIDASDIPITTKSLTFRLCHIKAPNGLKHLVNLTKFSNEYCDIDYTDKLPPSLVYFESGSIRRSTSYTNVSSLPNLKEVAGNRLSNIPWSQIVSASVPSIPNDARCESLKEVSILNEYDSELIRPNFKNIYCPNLKKVTLYTAIEGEITDIFTTTQLAQLNFFHGDGISVPDLTMLPQAEDLRVLYDEPLTRHTVLPSKLVKLFIESSEPVNGIPSQLEYFGLSNGTLEDLTVFNSATLKELYVVSEGPVSIDCPNLIDLTLNVTSIEECNVPNVEQLRLGQTLFPFERVPRLRHLIWGNTDISNVSIDSHLEYVYLENVHLSDLSISADNIDVSQYDVFDESFAATEFNDNYTCQQLTCDHIFKMPKSMESLIITSNSLLDVADFERHDDLKSICIEFAGSFTLTAPKNLEKLRILGADDPAVVHFVDTTKLEYIEYIEDEADEVVTPPAFIPAGFVQVGPTLWCRPDILQLWKPSSR